MTRPLVLLTISLVLASVSSAVERFGPPQQIASTPVDDFAVAYTTSGRVVAWRGPEGVYANGKTLSAVVATGVAVAAVENRALVAWTQEDGAVMVARVSATGSQIGSIVRIASNAAGPIVATAGEDRFLVAWATDLGDVYAAVFNRFGTKLVAPMPVTTQQSYRIREMRAEAAGNTFAVVWHGYPDPNVSATILNEVAMPLSMTPLVVTDRGAFPDVASNGESFYVVWNDTEVFHIHGRSLTADGAVGRVDQLTSLESQVARVVWDGFAYTIGYVQVGRPRPGVMIPFLSVFRVNENGGRVSYFDVVYGPYFARLFDLGAHDGQVELFIASIGGMTVQSAVVTEPRKKIRVVRK